MTSDFDDGLANIKRPYAGYALGVGAGAFAAVAVALVLQHAFGMEPCAWCTLQRLLFIIVGVLATGAWLVASTPGPARAMAGLGAVAGAAGVAAALWQQLVAAQTGSCALTLADRIIGSSQLDQSMPWLFQATAMCDEANLPLIGIPFAVWSAILFVVLTLILLIVAFARGPMK